MSATMPPLGLSEQEYRELLEQELVQAMRAEGGVPTIHAIAHAVARAAEVDHLRLAEQLHAAGVRLASRDSPAGGRAARRPLAAGRRAGSGGGSVR